MAITQPSGSTTAVPQATETAVVVIGGATAPRICYYYTSTSADASVCMIQDPAIFLERQYSWKTLPKGHLSIWHRLGAASILCKSTKLTNPEPVTAAHVMHANPAWRTRVPDQRLKSSVATLFALLV